MIATSRSVEAELDEAIRLVHVVCLSAEVLVQEPLTPQARGLTDRIVSAADEVADLLQSWRGVSAGGDVHGVIRGAGIEIDTRGHLVRVGGQDVHLALADFSLLAVLVARADTVVPHDELQELAWGKRLPTTNALYAHVNRIRRALEQHGISPDRLQVVRGMGYRLSST